MKNEARMMRFTLFYENTCKWYLYLGEILKISLRFFLKDCYGNATADTPHQIWSINRVRSSGPGTQAGSAAAKLNSVGSHNIKHGADAHAWLMLVG